MEFVGECSYSDRYSIEKGPIEKSSKICGLYEERREREREEYYIISPASQAYPRGLPLVLNTHSMTQVSYNCTHTYVKMEDYSLTKNNKETRERERERLNWTMAFPFPRFRPCQGQNNFIIDTFFV